MCALEPAPRQAHLCLLQAVRRVAELLLQAPGLFSGAVNSLLQLLQPLRAGLPLLLAAGQLASDLAVVPGPPTGQPETGGLGPTDNNRQLGWGDSGLSVTPWW